MGAETLQFIDVAAEADLAEGGMRAVQVAGKRVLLALVEGRPYAMGAICTHERANLDEGSLMGHEVYCPRHFSCFDVRTGEALAPPAEQSAAVYAVKVVDGKVLVSTTPVEPDDLDEIGEAPAPRADEAAHPETEEADTAQVAAQAAAPGPPAEPAVRCATPAPSSLHARIVAGIEAQRWLETGAQWLGTTLRPIRESALGGKLFDLLHGRVLGHALHPALSDMPIGLWTGAILLEVVDEPHAAAVLAAGGVVAGLATAVTGVADWTVSDGRDRRVGLLHGITQTVALCLVAGSVVLRAVDVETGSVVLLVAGTGLSVASAYLGGHLVFGRGVMVDHTAWTKGPRHWTRAIELGDLADGGAAAVDVEGRKVLVSRIDGSISAMENACTHAGGPLSMGAIRDGVVTCPWHGSCYRLRDGAVVKGPAQNAQPMLEARVRDGWVEVRAVHR